MLFFGWEGVGICSYLLIGFHYSDAQKGLLNGLAARKAFIMNRVGDLGLLIGLFLILAHFGTLEYTELYKKSCLAFENYQIANDLTSSAYEKLEDIKNIISQVNKQSELLKKTVINKNIQVSSIDTLIPLLNATSLTNSAFLGFEMLSGQLTATCLKRSMSLFLNGIEL